MIDSLQKKISIYLLLLLLQNSSSVNQLIYYDNNKHWNLQFVTVYQHDLLIVILYWSCELTNLVVSSMIKIIFSYFSYLQSSICLSCDLYISLFSWNSISISQSLITFIYDHLSVCLSCNLYISLFSRNLTPILHFHQLSSIERVSSISHSTSCTTRSVQIIRRKPQIKYLVRWLGYGPEYDMWYPIESLQNAQELIEEYEQLYNARKNPVEQPAKTSKHRGRPLKKVTRAVAKFAEFFKEKTS